MSESFDAMSDEELVELCRASISRTKEIFAVLYERYHLALFNFLRRYVGRADLAEDLLQETFLRVFRNLHSFRPERLLTHWIYTIALNAARDVMRRKRPGRLEVDVAAPADEPVERSEEHEILSNLILELPDEERAVFILARVDGRTLQEVADVMGFSLRTAKNRLADALERLARSMSALGIA